MALPRPRPRRPRRPRAGAWLANLGHGQRADLAEARDVSGHLLPLPTPLNPRRRPRATGNSALVQNYPLARPPARPPSPHLARRTAWVAFRDVTLARGNPAARARADLVVARDAPVQTLPLLAPAAPGTPASSPATVATSSRTGHGPPARAPARQRPRVHAPPASSPATVATSSRPARARQPPPVATSRRPARPCPARRRDLEPAPGTAASSPPSSKLHQCILIRLPAGRLANMPQGYRSDVQPSAPVQKVSLLAAVIPPAPSRPRAAPGTPASSPPTATDLEPPPAAPARPRPRHPPPPTSSRGAGAFAAEVARHSDRFPVSKRNIGDYGDIGDGGARVARHRQARHSDRVW